MDRWPGAYPASEPPTPAPETPQQQQQQPQYPVQQQQPERQPAPLSQHPAQTPSEHLFAAGTKPQNTGAHSHQQQPQPQSQSLTGHITQTAQNLLGRDSKPRDAGPKLQATGAQAHANFGVGFSNAADQRLGGIRGNTLDDERPPAAQEAVGGGTYTREGEERSFPTQLEAQPKHNLQHRQPEQAGWPLSNLGVQHEEQPRKVQQYRADPGHREVQEQQHGTASLSHGHQPSDLPITYQQKSHEVPQQPHVHPQQSRAVQQQPQETGSRGHGHQSSDLPLASQQQAHEVQQRPHELRHESRELSQQPRRAEQPSSIAEHSTRSSNSATGSNEQSSTPPYWGSLPTAPTGGIYNTVTGHGSARDDHDQNHNLPNKDGAMEHTTTTDATIPSATTSFPTGGIYNSVTGHGSHDESTKNHAAVGRHDHDATSRVPLGAGQARNAQHTTGPSGPLLGAESPVDNNRTTDRSGLTDSLYAQDADAHTTDRSTYGEAGTQRAFPLAVSDRDGHHEDKSHSRAEQGLAAGALAGTGIAAYEFSGKHDKQDGRDTREVAASHGHTPIGTEQRGIQQQQILHNTHTDEKRTSPDNKDKHKKHHGLFRSSGKHASEDKRDSRDIAPIPGTHPAGTDHRVIQTQPQAHLTSPPNEEAKRSSLDQKDMYKEDSPKRKGSVLGAIFHRHKDDKNEQESKHQHRRSDSIERRKLHKEPPQGVTQATRETTPPKKISIDEANHRQTGAVGGTFHDHGNTHKETHTGEYQSVDSGTGAYTSTVNDRASAVPSTRPIEKYDETSKHDHKGAVATGTGVAVGGFAASELAHRHAHSRDATKQTETTSDPASANGSGPYKVLPSGTPSGVATGAAGASHQSSSQNTSHISQGGYDREGDSHNFKPYNTLATGAASGIATTAASGATTTRNATASAPHDNIGSSNQDGQLAATSGPYGRLESGADSGVATGAGTATVMAASRGTEDSHPYDVSHGPTGRTGTFHTVVSNSQSSSAASGNDWRSSLPPIIATEQVGDTSTHGALQGTHSTGDLDSNPNATSRTTEGYVPAGIAYGKQSPSHIASTAGAYNTLESGTASGVAAAGAASSHSATHAVSGGARDITMSPTRSHQQDAGYSSDLPKPYNVLPSGTPSGVNIEYRRRSKEIEHQH